MYTINPKHRTRLIGSVLTAGVVFLTSLLPVQAKTVHLGSTYRSGDLEFFCAPSVSRGLAYRVIERRARRKAKADWKANAKGRYHFKKLTWKHGARDKRLWCRHSGGQYACAAKAIPCGYRLKR